jgi:hypothetical protein
MQHILRLKTYPAILGKVGVLIGVPGVSVEKPPLPVTVNLHLVRQKRVQRKHPAAPVTDDLCVGISPYEQVAHQRLPEHEGSHLRVRLVMEKVI